MELKNRLIKYFRSGEKNNKSIGIELEHFLLDKKNLRSYGYFEKNGQLEIINRLIGEGWKAKIIENENVLGAAKGGNLISFEPGGQLEISFKPKEKISEILDEYSIVMNEIKDKLTDDQCFASVGYHPASKVDELPLLPKKRYQIMYDFLSKKGSMAKNMMKGTASTQISIDYSDEKDFVKKYRASNYILPFLATLFDTTSVFEGEIYEGELLRQIIWENTDIERCKIPNGVFTKSFGYDEYAEYIMKSKPIFMIKGNDSFLTDEKTVSDIDAELEMSEEQLIHSTSMVFPDVRVKQFIEIRVADALPNKMGIIVAAVIKGIIYNEENLNKYYEYSRLYDDEDFKEFYRDITVHGESSKCDVFISLDKFLIDALIGLPDDEKHYLEDFISWKNENASWSKLLKREYQNNFENYKEIICLEV